MAVFKVETKNKVDIDKKPRVYFTCHPDDFEKHFKKVCDDIFKTHDCAIYYTEDMTEAIPDNQKDLDLGRSNLFVVPVTEKLLTTPNRAMDEDIPYALENHIPVLPILMELVDDELYSSKFGELQYLNPLSEDQTEIPYEEKLKKHLESLLISKELADRIRHAFYAYIFLSYRKVDRVYANTLMRLIHSIPECRDFAIWFDEFLTPGESFKANIEKALDNCKLFTFLVTERLFKKNINKNGEEENNFVMEEELPKAKGKRAEKGTKIIAVEMENAGKDAPLILEADDYIRYDDLEFRDRILAAVSKIKYDAVNTPEHTFLMGLAYLEGVDMEVDRERAVELIETAAEADLPEAINKLVNMYEFGICVPYNIDKAIMWQNRLICILERTYKKTHNKNDLVSLFWARHHCAELYISTKEYYFAEIKINKILPRLLSCKSYKENPVNVRWDICNCTLYAFLILSEISMKKGDLTECEKHINKAQSYYTNILIPYNDEDDDDTIKIIVSNYVAIYLQIARIHKDLHSYEKAYEYAQKALRLLALYLPETSALYNRRTEAAANEVAGDACFYCGDFENAKIYYEKMYNLAYANASNVDNMLYQRDFAYSCNRMGEIMLQNKRLEEAKQYFLKSFHISRNMKLRNDEDDGNIAFCYNRFGDISWQKNMNLTRALYYRKAFKIRLGLFKKHNDLESIMHLAYSYVNLGRTSLLRRKYYFAEAKKLFEILIDQSQTPDFYREELRILVGS